MSDGLREPENLISPFAVATLLLRNRWRLTVWMAVGGVVGLATAVFDAPLYTATASFVPQSAEAGRSGLASLAGQFGVAIPTGNEANSPDFYVRLLKSRELLGPVGKDSVAVPERGNHWMTALDLFKIPPGSPDRRLDDVVKTLGTVAAATVDKSTSVVDLRVTTEWPSVSLWIARSLLNGVNNFNQRTRQGQAAAERRFVESRLALAKDDLRTAEDRVEGFMANNREYGKSPDLAFQRERLQRSLTLQQQIFNTLTQSYEEVRMREVRDTPVITIIDQPHAPGTPNPRERGRNALFGLLGGAFVGSLTLLITDVMARRRAAGDADANELATMIRSVGWRRTKASGKGAVPASHTAN